MKYCTLIVHPWCYQESKPELKRRKGQNTDLLQRGRFRAISVSAVFSFSFLTPSSTNTNTKLSSSWLVGYIYTVLKYVEHEFFYLRKGEVPEIIKITKHSLSSIPILHHSINCWRNTLRETCRVPLSSLPPGWWGLSLFFYCQHTAQNLPNFIKNLHCLRHTRTC